MAEEKDYEVGFKKPPKHTQFKKGQSGNPSGRPKKVRNEEEIMLRELNALVPITEGGKKKSMTKMEIVLKRQVNLAMQGDPKAVRFVSELYRAAKKNREAAEGEEVMTVTLVFEEEEERAKEIAESNRRWRERLEGPEEEF
ncbi:hypothetical protein SAMN06297468_1006 [Altererythrobacter xiamenensis]|uniref:DUF5681 domain-containing protein n=1 Tax=Altererythrobacter xiamenensis TaxID=1316679 RepID=A0A1Y6EV74_9SPHN|nr:DUF5681 domain-containing protein [Altererythrobacter xiamenensis]SMQ64392.1 hypothetical protein SAMN06297468_1006 [Altererythrobacter xiamenensis]